MSDVRFLAWAGYDLSGKQEHYYSIGWPDMDSDEVGGKRIKAKEMKSSISIAEELQPTMRYKRHDMRPSISGQELKPFPKPIST